MRSDKHSNGRHILVVDDEPLVRRSLSEFLTLQGYSVSSAGNGKEALEVLKSYTADIVITDIKMPEIGGIELLREIKKEHHQTPVILMTGYGSIENAVEAIKEGAYDYVTKPIVDSDIKLVIERLINQRGLQEENEKLKLQLSVTQRERFHNIVGKDEKMQKIYTLIEAISATGTTVLIHGESGTGKRLIAHAVHKYNEEERGKPFIEVSCGALTETLLESELFGHTKGSFTGAIKDRIGRFELASGGSIFLDEIDASSPALQVKLLRVLQDGEFERVGDSKTLHTDARVIAATNQNLLELIAQGKFRKDLYYRLNIITIEIPPLRDRKGDIPLLADEFTKKHAKHIRKKIEGISEDALEMLEGYNWPGNVRELENAIERAIILCKDKIITPADLPKTITNNLPAGNKKEDSLKLRDALKSPEKDLILKALQSADWNRNNAARVLGINRTTLYKKMRKFGLLQDNKTNAKAN